jgi:hypothetical protein
MIFSCSQGGDSAVIVRNASTGAPLRVLSVHLSYHYVACWRHEKGTMTIEVNYVGSRENAPY